MSLLPSDQNDAALPMAGAPSIDGRDRDFVMLTIFVMVQHGYFRRAAALSEALALSGDRGPDLIFARMVLRFFSRDWASALAMSEELERVDPAERFGAFTLTDRQRMRRYIRLRCLHELGETAHVRDAIEIYLRRGDAGSEEEG